MRLLPALLVLAAPAAANDDIWLPLKRAQEAARESGKGVFLYVFDEY